ncbi:hypothetical protein DPEC_G00158730 [Dallia pectoralis]|uniref:Uncharacterized protein n=1 Tax=Dallia pectoralis TaxID=75939 RepID=A0ACC2GFT9_DALPE|nr:hypothetical protein DPEC_G00158730 [Dallia pectoralis]
MYRFQMDIDEQNQKEADRKALLGPERQGGVMCGVGSERQSSLRSISNLLVAPERQGSLQKACSSSTLNVGPERHGSLHARTSGNCDWTLDLDNKTRPRSCVDILISPCEQRVDGETTAEEPATDTFKDSPDLRDPLKAGIPKEKPKLEKYMSVQWVSNKPDDAFPTSRARSNTTIVYDHVEAGEKAIWVVDYTPKPEALDTINPLDSALAKAGLSGQNPKQLATISSPLENILHAIQSYSIKPPATPQSTSPKAKSFALYSTATASDNVQWTKDYSNQMAQSPGQRPDNWEFRVQPRVSVVQPAVQMQKTQTVTEPEPQEQQEIAQYIEPVMVPSESLVFPPDQQLVPTDAVLFAPTLLEPPDTTLVSPVPKLVLPIIEIVEDQTMLQQATDIEIYPHQGYLMVGEDERMFPHQSKSWNKSTWKVKALGDSRARLRGASSETDLACETTVEDEKEKKEEDMEEREQCSEGRQEREAEERTGGN